MITIKELIAMKKEKNVPFGTQYRYLIQTIENDLVSKSNGVERVQQLLLDYDDSARLFIVHQFVHIGEDKLAHDLLSMLELDPKNTFLEDKYVSELVDNTLL